MPRPPSRREGGTGLSIYALKPRFQSILRPLTAVLARSGVTANQVTLAAGIVSIALGVFIALNAPARWPFALIPLVIFTSRRDVMGVLVNHRLTIAAAVVVATIISGLNIFLLGQTFGLLG